MNLLTYLQFAFTKRYAIHWIYRRMLREYPKLRASLPIWLPYAIALPKNRSRQALLIAIISFLFIPTVMIIITIAVS